MYMICITSFAHMLIVRCEFSDVAIVISRHRLFAVDYCPLSARRRWMESLPNRYSAL